MSTLLVGVLGLGLVDPATAVLRADDLGVSRGDGCFETCRVVTDASGRSTIDNLDPHLARLGRSLAALDITADLAACRALLDQVVDAWTQPGETAVKLMVTRGIDGGTEPTVLATLAPIKGDSLRQRTEGVRAVSLTRGTPADVHAAAPWLLGGVKSLSYALNMAALREAERRGAEDVIWTSSDGLVLESPTSTILWSDGGQTLLTTPVGATGILAGTTLAGLFADAAGAGFTGATAEVTLPDLAAAEAIWLASSIRGVAEVVELDGVPRRAHPDLTARLAAFAGF